MDGNDNLSLNFFSDSDPFRDLHILPDMNDDTVFSLSRTGNLSTTKDNLCYTDIIPTPVTAYGGGGAEKIRAIKKRRQKVCHNCGKAPADGLYERSNMRFTTCPNCPKMCSFKTCPVQEDCTMGFVGLLHSGFCSMHSRQYTNEDRFSSWAPQHPHRKHAHPFIYPILTSKEFIRMEKDIELLYTEETILQLSLLRLYDTPQPIDPDVWTRIKEISTARCHSRGYLEGYKEIQCLPIVLSLSLCDKEGQELHINPHIDVENARITHLKTTRDTEGRIQRDQLEFTIRFLPCFLAEINALYTKNPRVLQTIKINHISLRNYAHTQRFHVPLLLCDGSGRFGYGQSRPEHEKDISWSFRPFRFFRQVPFTCRCIQQSFSDQMLFTLDKENHPKSSQHYTTTSLNTTTSANIYHQTSMQLRDRNLLKQQFRSCAVAAHNPEEKEIKIPVKKKRKRGRRKKNTPGNGTLGNVLPDNSHLDNNTENKTTAEPILFDYSSYLPHGCAIRVDIDQKFSSRIKEITVVVKTKMPVGAIGAFCKQEDNSFWQYIYRETDLKKVIDRLQKHRKELKRGINRDPLFSIM